MKMHSRKSANLSIASGHVRTSSGLSPGNGSSGVVSPRFPPSAARRLLGPSPPPSPALPSLIPRHGRKPPRHSHRQLRKMVFAFGACLMLVWLVVLTMAKSTAQTRLNFNVGSTAGALDQATPLYEMVEDSALPEDPSVVVVADAKGKTRWTVSLPHDRTFPLRPAEYRELCTQAAEITAHVDLLASGKNRTKRQTSYNGVDPYFLDIEKAEAQGLLGRPGGVDASQDSSVCKKSLTYVLDDQDPGFGAGLMGLWLSYGLAQTESRAFFVDDSRWVYGNYSTYFRAPPTQSCTQPAASQRVPCPHSAAHLVVSAATFEHTFGASFLASFSTLTSKPHLGRESAIYSLARTGYEALFHLADKDDVGYVQGIARDVMQQARAEGGTVVGLHVRRGNQRPWDAQYENDYLPLTHFQDEAGKVLSKLHARDESVSQANSEPADDNNNAESTRSYRATATKYMNHFISSGKQYRRTVSALAASKVLIASDDPDIYDAAEFSHTMRTQDRIILASKTALERAQTDEERSRKSKFLDEVHGWEGGFYRDLFWALGRDEQARGDARKPSARADDESPSPAALGLRALVARAYLLDLAVLAEADEVICGVSAMGCRLLAVMMGEAKVRAGHWRNIDGSFSWTGVAW